MVTGSEFDSIYAEYCENLGAAPKQVKDAYQVLRDAFEEYLCASEEWRFRSAFEFGLDYAARTDIRKAV